MDITCRMSITVYSLWISLGFIALVQGQFSYNIPIGALFEKSAPRDDLKERIDMKEIEMAFSSEVKRHNNEQSRLQIQIRDVTLDMLNSFEIISATCRLMKVGIFALFGTHRMYTVNTFKSYTKAYRIPFITPGMAVNESGQEYGYELYMRPYTANALLDIIKTHLMWKKFTYIFYNEEGLYRMQQLFDAITMDGLVIQTAMRQVYDVDDAFHCLRSIYTGNKDDTKNYVVLDMSTKDTQELLQKQKLESWKVGFHYLLVNLGIDEVELDDFAGGGVNVTGLSLIDKKRSNVKLFLERWKTQFLTDNITYEQALVVDSVNLLEITLKRLFKSEESIFRRILQNGRVKNGNGSFGIDCQADPIIPWSLGFRILQEARNVEFSGITGRIQFDNFGLRTGHELLVLESSRKDGLSQIGTWTETRGFKQLTRPTVPVKPGGVLGGRPKPAIEKNKTYIVTSILSAPYLMQKPDADLRKGNDRFEGYCADLAEKIAKATGFNYTIMVVKDGNYGGKDENGTWNGMVGEVIRHEADLCIAPISITSIREEVIDFSKPFMSLGITIMIQKPVESEPAIFSFMYPLSNEIWMCVVFAYIGVSVVLFLVSRFSPFEWQVEDDADGPTVTNNFTFFNSLWFSLGAFMQQGCDFEPKSLSGRIVSSMWWFFTLILISTYTANLAAFLTMARMASPIESAEDLAAQTEIKYGSVASGSTTSFFRTSTIPVYERMWAFMSSAEPGVFVSSNNEGIRRVRESKGRYAFLAESTTIEYINQQKPCDTITVGANLDSKGYGIATPIGSPLRDQISLNVLELHEKGELRELEQKWWYEMGECGGSMEGKKTETTSALQWPGVAGIFYILMVGMAVGIFSSICEFFWHSSREAKRTKTTFANAVRSKARLSIKGKPDNHEKEVTAYTYAPAAQLVSLDGYSEGNTHTQV